MLKILYRITIAVLFVALLSGLIAYARGYRFDLSQKNLKSTGILVASSTPDGAKIYINNELYGATNTNITLPPGNYHVEIKKDGYLSWTKDVTIKGELVIKADALLFPQNPSLSPITSLGVTKGFSSPDGKKVIILSEGADTEKGGVYLLDSNTGPLSITNPLKFLTATSLLPSVSSFTHAHVLFAPTKKDIILDVYDEAEKQIIASYLIDTTKTEGIPFDISRSRAQIITAWELQHNKNTTKLLETFKDPLPSVATDSFRIVSFSPDETKILYQAKINTTLPPIIKPPLIATNQTKQQRTLIKGNLYVYDTKEDKNYEISNFNSQISNSVFWYPTSAHLVVQQDSQIVVMDYDTTNRRTVYSGPFDKSFICITTDGKILILTNLNTQTNLYPDVYAVGIR